MKKDLNKLYATQLKKAIAHLKYSYKKVQNMPADVEHLSEEELETWESFSSRFSRVSEIFLNRYLRSLILKSDPGFTGSFRDFLNQAEKESIIQNAKLWLEIREYRNKEAHEYNDKTLSLAFQEMRRLAIHLLDIEKLL